MSTPEYVCMVEPSVKVSSVPVLDMLGRTHFTAVEVVQDVVEQALAATATAAVASVFAKLRP